MAPIQIAGAQLKAALGLPNDCEDEVSPNHTWKLKIDTKYGFAGNNFGSCRASYCSSQ
jgi:hypothetical protein